MRISLLGAVAVAAWLALASTATAAAIVVDSTGDAVAPADNVCTLREALLNAGSDMQLIDDCAAGSGADSIRFALAGARTIAVLSSLPEAGDVIIDGGVARVRLDGDGAGSSTDGLQVTGTATLRNLVITRFRGDGVEVRGQGRVVLQDSLIGTDGSTRLGNSRAGVHLLTAGNTVEDNVLAGNGEAGLVVEEGGFGSPDDNVIAGNLIGTADGTTPVPNVGGVEINAGARNLVGGQAGSTGACTAACNVVSGSFEGGIAIQGTASDTVVSGNRVGTDLAGTAPLKNEFSGILVSTSSPGTRIGGTTPATRNILGANSLSIFLTGSGGATVTGNYVGLAVDGVTPVGVGRPGQGILIYSPGNVVTGNVIAGNRSHGVYLSFERAEGNVIAGNLIGTRADQTAPAPNLGSGVRIDNGAHGNTIGGDTPAEANVIAGSSADGVTIQDNGTVENRVVGNAVGTDGTGTRDLGNHMAGIAVTTTASRNVIGGDILEEENLVVHNGGPGILIAGDGADGNVVGRNRGFDNHGLFLDLRDPLGVGNDPLLGAAAGAQPPLIATADTAVASGTAPAGATVRVYRAPALETVDGLIASAVADGAGAWQATYAAAVPVGTGLLATQTTLAGTSEASGVVETVAAAPSPSPSPSPSPPPSPSATASPEPTATPAPAPTAAIPAPAPSSTPAPAADRPRPVVTRFSARRRGRGTTFRFTLSEAGRVRIVISGPRTARRRGTLTRAAARRGANSVAFGGRIAGRRLPAGRYTATLTATDAAGNASRAVRAHFRVR